MPVDVGAACMCYSERALNHCSIERPNARRCSGWECVLAWTLLQAAPEPTSTWLCLLLCLHALIHEAVCISCWSSAAQ